MSIMQSIIEKHDNDKKSARSASLESNRKPILVCDIEEIEL